MTSWLHWSVVLMIVGEVWGVLLCLFLSWRYRSNLAKVFNSATWKKRKMSSASRMEEGLSSFAAAQFSSTITATTDGKADEDLTKVTTGELTNHQVEDYGRVTLTAAERAKILWSRWLLVYIVSAMGSQLFGWSLQFIKCLDTSGTLADDISPELADYLCNVAYAPFSRHTQEALWVCWFVLTIVGVASFQWLVVERYRMLAPLFPKVLTSRILPVYMVFFCVLTLANIVLGLLEFYLARSTLLPRGKPLNTLSSAIYALFFVCSGGTDIVLSLWILAIVSKSHKRAVSDHDGYASTAATSGRPRMSWRGDVLGRLKRLRLVLIAILVLDFAIVTITPVKHIEPGWAWELNSLEVSLSIIHCTVTLTFMQILGVILRPSQPQFEFAERSSIYSADNTHSLPPQTGEISAAKPSDYSTASSAASSSPRKSPAILCSIVETSPLPQSAATAMLNSSISQGPASVYDEIRYAVAALPPTPRSPVAALQSYKLPPSPSPPSALPWESTEDLASQHNLDAASLKVTRPRPVRKLSSMAEQYTGAADNQLRRELGIK
ncbi:hypothetical protein PYCC9005_002843 [Savitreella phatthalungensis]